MIRRIQHTRIGKAELRPNPLDIFGGCVITGDYRGRIIQRGPQEKEYEQCHRAHEKNSAQHIVEHDSIC